MSAEDKFQFFVQPEIVRVPLPLPVPGDWWIEIRRELNVGEIKAMQSSALYLQREGADGRNEARLDMGRLALQKVLSYLVDWNIPDVSGKVPRVTEYSIRALRPLVFDAIDKAIDEWTESLSVPQPTSSTSSDTA